MINIDTQFDDRYYESLKPFFDTIFEEYIIDADSEEEAIRQIEETKSEFNEEELLLIIAVVTLFFEDGSIELLEKINSAASEKDLGEAEFLFEEWIDANIDMIMNIDGTVKDIYKQKVESSFKNALKGATTKEILDIAREKTIKAIDNRAKFWAVDQTGVLVAGTVEGAFKALERLNYRWIHMGDSKVRPLDRYNGDVVKIFNFRDGDSEGTNPGGKPGCRCGYELV